METWLIQRGNFENREHKNGIDSILNFDYMGSSEFEWGALPKSLGNIRSELNEYTYLDVPMQDKVITVFCKDSQKSDIKTYLTELAENKMRLKEFSAFDSYIKNDGYLIILNLICAVVAVDFFLKRNYFSFDHTIRICSHNFQSAIVADGEADVS